MTNLINHSALRNPAPSLPQHNTLLQMPQDILTQILNYLPGQEIVESALVCRQWNQKLKDNDVWRVLFYHRFSSVNTTPIQNFRNAYRAIYSNLTKGVYASDTFQGHRGTIYCLAIFDGKLFSGSDDKTIKVWDLKTGECTATLIGTQSSVYSLAVFDGKLFSGSDDCTIKVWDLITGEYTALTGHEDAVCSLAVFDGKLFSGSDDKTIKVWDLKTRQCTATLTGHDDSVSSPVVFDGKLFSGSSDETIKVWDLKTGECTATLTGHQGSVCSLAAFDGKLFSASDDGTIKVWDLKTRQCTATLTGHEDSVSSLAIFDGKLFSGSSDFKIKVWDFTADHRNIFREIAHSLEGQQQPVIDALKRFSRMPKTAKHAIYGKVYGNPFANEYPGCAEFAFHNQNGQRATRVEKAQAIRNYLNDQPSKNNPLLLAHLGIQTEKQYSEKLNCRSEYLEKIGILSVEDLKFICSASPHFLKLDTLQILEVEGDFRDNKVKIEAERRKNNLTTLTGQISQLVEDKIQETNTCGVILYEGRCPWVSFQHKLKAFQAKLGEIADKSHTAKSMVEAFHSKNYNGLADQLNGLIEEFQTLDLDYQISKLHIYVNQWGILTAWNNLRAQAVQNLCLLPGSKQSLQKLFQMGE